MEQNQVNLENENNLRNFNLSSYTAARSDMIAANEEAYKIWNSNLSMYRHHKYTDTEIQKILEQGSLDEIRTLSRVFFETNGQYRRFILYLATLPRYSGLLSINPINNSSLSNLKKKYNKAINYVETMNIKNLGIRIMTNALVNGCYYGLRVIKDKKVFSILDLPYGYVRNNLYDFRGNPVMELNISYFNTITDEEKRKNALKCYPKEIQRAWAHFTKGKIKLDSCWVIIPSEYGICIPMFDGIPSLVNSIPALMQYKTAAKAELEKELDEIRKIIVQQIPHLNDGRLVFEPDEAAEMHRGAVEMTKGQGNTTVVTSYADVQVITPKSSNETNNSFVDRMTKNVFNELGSSDQLFAATGSSTLGDSIKKDLAFVMAGVNNISVFITNLLNELFGDSNTQFKYTILPITEHNYSEYLENAFKLITFGYSFTMPVLAMGITQQELVGIKIVENDILKLDKVLTPLASAFNQSSSDKEASTDDNNKSEEAAKQELGKIENPGGKPAKEQSEKAETTITKEKSLDKTANGGT